MCVLIGTLYIFQGDVKEALLDHVIVVLCGVQDTSCTNETLVVGLKSLQGPWRALPCGLPLSWGDFEVTAGYVAPQTVVPT